MPLVLEEVKLSDFPKIASYIDPSDQGDDLVSPAVSPAFPVTNEEDARARIALSNKQQEDFLRLDPTTRIAKVVDTDQGANEIIALARWNRYQEGFKASRLDYCGDADPDEGSSWPEGMDVKFYKELCDAVYLHADWMGKGPYWRKCGVLVVPPSCAWNEVVSRVLLDQHARKGEETWLTRSGSMQY